MSILSLVNAACTRLIESGIRPEEAGFDAEVLARHLLGWDRATYFTERHRKVTRAFDKEYITLIARRARREPVAYLTGQREFWGLEFAITPDTLIPRPETELLIETVLHLRPDRSIDGVLVDVGTGSGCIAVVLAIEFPNMTIVATDISQPALAVAQANAKRHGVSERIEWRHGPQLAGLSGPIDLIVSNPPYVTAQAMQHLAPEVRNHEPHVALHGGTGGTRTLRALIAEASVKLVNNGSLVVEFGCDQEAVFRQVVNAAHLTDTQVLHDIQGLPRVGVATSRTNR